jgi:hypothetical protein
MTEATNINNTDNLDDIIDVIDGKLTEKGKDFLKVEIKPNEDDFEEAENKESGKSEVKKIKLSQDVLCFETSLKLNEEGKYETQSEKEITFDDIKEGDDLSIKIDSEENDEKASAVKKMIVID